MHRCFMCSTLKAKLLWVVILAVVTSAGFVVVQSVGNARSKARQGSCDGNLATIGILLQSYKIKHGQLPPAIMYDKNGRAMHNWRAVLVKSELSTDFADYDLDRAWNSEENVRFASRMPNFFSCGNENAHVKGADVSSYFLANCIRNATLELDHTLRVLLDGPVAFEANGIFHSWLEPVDSDALVEELNSQLDWSSSGIGADPDGIGLLNRDGTVVRKHACGSRPREK